MKETPRVSILIPNYNYGRYLGRCLESALNQTYENLEVVFVDNHSNDGSYDIALDFQTHFKDRMRVYRNDENIGGSQNHEKANSIMDPRTKCYIYLSSDDFFDVTLVERCMEIMEHHPSTGFVLVHRNAIDENDQISEEIPFYNCSCVIPGTKQMEVFMMAGVGVSTQCFRNRHVETAGDSFYAYRFDVAGDWYSNFCLASVSDMGYIKDPLCTYRTHYTNVTNRAIKNLTNSMEHILMLHAFNEMAINLRRASVSRRLQPAIEKLGTMCLRYCTQLLHEGDGYTAKRYLHLAPVLRRDITDDPSWQTLWRLAHLSAEECRLALIEFEASSPQKRLVSYDPPEGAIMI
jgi:glycosyltransferase involved in cell wall biosynthesis